MNIKRNSIFLLDKEKDKPDAKLRLRIKWDENTVAFNVGFRIDIDKWSTEAQRCNSNTIHGKKKIHSSVINKEIQRFEQASEDTFYFFEQKKEVPSADEFRDEFNKRIGKVTRSEKTLFDCHNEFMIEKGKESQWTESTYKEHMTIRRHLLDFAPKLEFSDLNEKGISMYVDYMLNMEVNSKKKGLKNTSIRKNLDNLRWFLRWASEKGYNHEMAFESFQPKLKTVENKVIFLDWDELMKVYNFQIPENKKHLDKVRDVFCFCCFTSLRYSDVANLKRTDIFDTHISVTTIKTNDSLRIELNDYSKEILEKYKNETFEKNIALPVITNQKMNTYLKELGEICEINSPVSITYYKGSQRIDEVHPKYELLGTHAGRKTFICNALMLGIAPQVVMKWTGHADYKAMKPYIDIADAAKQQAMSLFNKKQSPIQKTRD